MRDATPVGEVMRSLAAAQKCLSSDRKSSLEVAVEGMLAAAKGFVKTCVPLAAAHGGCTCPRPPWRRVGRGATMCSRHFDAAVILSRGRAGPGRAEAGREGGSQQRTPSIR